MSRTGGKLRSRFRGGSALFCLCLALALATTGAGGGQQARDPLAGAKGKRAVALFFIGHDCPISNAYAPEIQRLYAQYAPQKIAFYLVYADPDITLGVATRHAKAYGYGFPLLLDPAHQLTRKVGATVTPEAALLTPQGRLLYRGRIDDQYADYGRRREIATRHDLRLALEAVVQGRAVPHRFTRAIGCFIPTRLARPARTSARP